MDNLSEIRAALDQVKFYLQQRPSAKIEMGVLPDNPTYGKETRALEQIQSELSLAIRKLQHLPKNDDPRLVELRRFARKLENEMKGAYERVESVNVHELLASGSDQIHEYHEKIHQLQELTEPPRDFGYYSAELQPSMAGSVEAFVALFSIIAACVQLRKRRKQ